MTKIGLLSDTHGHIDERILNFFDTVDEIWHAGDVGSVSILDKISNLKPLKAVYGNIDAQDVQLRTKETLVFYCEEVKVIMTHIAKYHGTYSRKLMPFLLKEKPQLVIGGHSHILQIKYDRIYNFLFVNPGASGNYGIHKIKTACRFDIEKDKIQNMEILELTKT